MISPVSVRFWVPTVFFNEVDSLNTHEADKRNAYILLSEVPSRLECVGTFLLVWTVVTAVSLKLRKCAHCNRTYCSLIGPHP
jgi:hypothetical protein